MTIKTDKRAIYEVNPYSLLNFNRLDLAFKLCYLSIKNNYPEYATKIYRKHLKIFTSGTFSESNSNKKGFEDYLEEFNRLFESISSNGFEIKQSVIPLSKDKTLTQGSHRTSICIFLNEKIYVKNTSLPSTKYGYNFFKERGLDSIYIDQAVKKYLEYSNKTYLAIIWPSANNKVNVFNTIKNVVYHKKFKLTPIGAHNFITQTYKSFDWVGNFEDGYGGAYKKLSECFNSFDIVNAIYFDENSLDNVLKIKNHLRELYGIEKSSIHITDNTQEAYYLSQYILNDNSLDFLNYAKPYKSVKLNQQIFKLKKEINDINDFLFIGNSVLASFGELDEENLEYIDLKKINNMENKQFLLEMFYNPNNHYYYNDLKFARITYLNKLKHFSKSKINDRILKKLIKNIKSKNYFFNSLNAIKFKFIGMLIPLTIKFGLYDFSKNIYKILNKSEK